MTLGITGVSENLLDLSGRTRPKPDPKAIISCPSSKGQDLSRTTEFVSSTRSFTPYTRTLIFTRGPHFLIIQPLNMRTPPLKKIWPKTSPLLRRSQPSKAKSYLQPSMATITKKLRPNYQNFNLIFFSNYLQSDQRF